MPHPFSRTELLFGKEAMEKFSAAKVAVFGIGGVGGHTAEALVRSGVGTVALIDDDKVCLSNINRQIFATHKTLGEYKVDAATERLLEINPSVKIEGYKLFYTPENAHTFDLSPYDYIVDAIDTVSGKLTLVENAEKAGVPIISSMGAGNKLDPTAFEVTDISKTSVCPLARVMRYELKRRGIKHLKVVYSKEIPLKPIEDPEVCCVEQAIDSPGAGRVGAARRQIPGSTAFVPSVVGLIIAGEVLKDLSEKESAQ